LGSSSVELAGANLSIILIVKMALTLVLTNSLLSDCDVVLCFLLLGLVSLSWLVNWVLYSFNKCVYISGLSNSLYKDSKTSSQFLSILSVVSSISFSLDLK
jgi:hypothetical protein